MGRSWSWNSGHQSILTFIVLLHVELQASSPPCLSFPFCKISRIKLTWNFPSISNSNGGEVPFHKLLKCLERKMLCQPKIFLLFCFQKKGVYGAFSSSGPEWWLEPARPSICPRQRMQEEWRCQKQMQQKGNYASPGCQHVIRVFLWEPRAESGGRRCGREGGGRSEEEREMEEMKGSMPVLHSSLSWGELYQTKARPINQAIISCKEKALTSSSNWLIHLAAQDRLALLRKNCELARLSENAVGRRGRSHRGSAGPGEFCATVYSLEEGNDRWQVRPVLSPGGYHGPGPWKSNECAGFAGNYPWHLWQVIWFFLLGRSFTICKRERLDQRNFAYFWFRTIVSMDPMHKDIWRLWPVKTWLQVQVLGYPRRGQEFGISWNHLVCVKLETTKHCLCSLSWGLRSENPSSFKAAERKKM